MDSCECDWEPQNISIAIMASKAKRAELNGCLVTNVFPLGWRVNVAGNGLGECVVGTQRKTKIVLNLTGLNLVCVRRCVAIE